MKEDQFKILIAITLFQLAFGFYLYGIGERDGVIHYKRSHQFARTLYSMYRFGYLDGADTCKEKK